MPKIHVGILKGTSHYSHTPYVLLSNIQDKFLLSGGRKRRPLLFLLRCTLRCTVQHDSRTFIDETVTTALVLLLAPVTGTFSRNGVDCLLVTSLRSDLNTVAFFTQIGSPLLSIQARRIVLSCRHFRFHFSLGVLQEVSYQVFSASNTQQSILCIHHIKPMESHLCKGFKNSLEGMPWSTSSQRIRRGHVLSRLR